MPLDHKYLKQRQRAERSSDDLCSAFLGKLVPYVIQLMMDNPRTLWGDACYPVVET
jgi:hypothetical protein